MNDDGDGGATFKEIGEALGVSRWRAQQIYDRAMWKMRRALIRSGIRGADVQRKAESMLAQAETWADSDKKGKAA